MHLVFSLAQLKSSLKFDSFRRSISEHSKSMFVEGDIKELKSYVLKRLLNKRVCYRGKGESMKYLIRWQGYDPEFDT